MPMSSFSKGNMLISAHFFQLRSQPSTEGRIKLKLFFFGYVQLKENNRVATNLENMENLENSGNLKNCQSLRGISIFVEKTWKTQGK